MTMDVNVWIAISATATKLIKTRLQWDDETQGEYTGPVTDLEHKIFERMAHFRVTENLWKRPTIAGKKWQMFSLNFPKGPKAKEALDWITANRAGHFYIMGAWNWDDGLLTGLRFVLDEDGNRIDDQVYDDEIPNQKPVWRTTGTAVYATHNQLIKFMPPIITYDSEGVVVSNVAATELTDINLIQGQAPRIWE